MTFEEIFDQAITMLRRRGRVSYRALKLQFNLDEEHLAVLKDEIVEVHQLAVDQDGTMLVWVGDAAPPPDAALPPATPDAPRPAKPPPADLDTPDAERRQLSVMFCDLVGSTSLSEQRDPEELREIVRAYQQTCSEVVDQFGGHVAQLLGDALLIYFGWPQAHEDDAQRAVRTGLGILDAIDALNIRLQREKGITLAIRVGIHTGLAVVGEMGSGDYKEQLALGETPNIASRVQNFAMPNTVVISEGTRRLVSGIFDLEDRGPQELRGLSRPIRLYEVLGESAAESRFEASTGAGLSPLVGREEEINLLYRRWEHAKESEGQLVLLSGEPGIGKSRVIEALGERIKRESHFRLRYQCSPYHQHSAFYPIIRQIERAARFARDDSPAEKLDKLEAALTQSTERVAEVAPLFAELLGLPTDYRYTPLDLSPQQQREKILEALIDQMIGLSHRNPVLLIFEDAHWSDPTSLAVLDLLVNHAYNMRVLIVISYRPEFQVPWVSPLHVTELTLNRFSRAQSATVVQGLTGGKALPPIVLEQVLAKSDGVPLFVEELTKTVIESDLLYETEEHYVLREPLPPLAIPSTLQDSLMARLDRMGQVKEVAQIGACLGREFAHEVITAVAPQLSMELDTALGKLEEAGLVLRRGQPPEVRYVFKHALLQDAAYASLLLRTRQQLHVRIANTLAERFPAICAAEPEILAHHYTEAGIHDQAIVYWHKAGQKAKERTAYSEAISHLTKGLELIEAFPETPEYIEQKLKLYIDLGGPLQVTKGFASQDVEHVYTRARQLCQQVEDNSQIFSVLWGLWRYYTGKGDLRTAHELAVQCFSAAEHLWEPTRLIEAHRAQGITLHHLGQMVPAHQHFEQCMMLYTPSQHRSLAYLYGDDPGVACLSRSAHVLWMLGYPDQAQRKSDEALALAHEVSHPSTLAYAQIFAAIFHEMCRDRQAAQQRAEIAMTLSTEHGLALWLTVGKIIRGWARAMAGEGKIGNAEIRQGIDAFRALGTELYVSYYLALLATGHAKAGNDEAGLRELEEALAIVDKTEERFYEAELHRLRGELLQKTQRTSDETEATPESCFYQALDVARRQQAKSWELRAATSMSRLWQRQNKRREAKQLLTEVYNWFTEGFDTPDLREARMLLQAL